MQLLFYAFLFQCVLMCLSIPMRKKKSLHRFITCLTICHLYWVIYSMWRSGLCSQTSLRDQLTSGHWPTSQHTRTKEDLGVCGVSGQVRLVTCWFRCSKTGGWFRCSKTGGEPNHWFSLIRAAATIWMRPGFMDQCWLEIWCPGVAWLEMAVLIISWYFMACFFWCHSPWWFSMIIDCIYNETKRIIVDSECCNIEGLLPNSVILVRSIN